MYDSTIRARARGLKNLGSPVFLRWGHEMNGNWYPWSGYANNDRGATNGPARYVAAFRHIHNIFESEGANNVLWVWSPNSESVPNSGWNHWTKYYPGDAYVDWVGIDGYNWGSTESWSMWRSFRRIFRPVYDDYAGRKPIMIAETASVEQGGDKSRWIAGMWTQVRVHMTGIKAVVYFNVPKGHSWPITSSSSAQRKYRNMGNAPYFRRVEDSNAPEVTGLDGDSGAVIDVSYEGSEPAKVSVKVKNNSGSVVRRLRRYRWASPILRSERWDTRNSSGRKVPEGNYRVEVVATDPAGHSTVATQWVRVSR
jgi:hypothetical protein